ncbi:hypothetical protein LSCM1_02603 [Leishmania martiniquensis]|uniref:Uncharacterized protein n=1 Tax=Leishmania martiniquensis TaxID=1580590 RepID=A0A836KD45_9TRYP|nr:hypothetical protein LSCM1_02603 [Leishmania martiniquensis]
MGRYVSWRTAPLPSAVLMAALLFFTLYSAAARTRGLHPQCFSTETEPCDLSRGIVEGRNEHPEAAVSCKPLDTGALAHGSRITVSMLVRPSSLLGSITCSAQSAAPALRCSAVGRAALYGESNALSVKQRANLLFSEACRRGSVVFMPGTRELVFHFTAPPTAPVNVSNFTLRVLLRGKDTLANSGGAQAACIPLLYTVEIVWSKRTGLRCTAETQRNTCYVTALDGQGPAHLNAMHFRVRVERVGEAVAVAADKQGPLAADRAGADAQHWVDVTSRFSLSVHLAPLYPHVGAGSWAPGANDAIYGARLRAYASTDGQDIGARIDNRAIVNDNRADVVGSPYSLTGTVPNAQSVKLRGCRYSVIASGSMTVCFIDLANGVSGDTSFYLITTSKQESSVSNATYVPYDDACMCPSLWFTYHAPTALSSRVYDALKVFVYTDIQRSVDRMVMATNAPLRLEVLPVVPESGQDDPQAPTETVLVFAGLLFYGSVLFVGGVLIVRRSRKSARIRHERALKERAMMQEMDRRRGAPSPSAEDLTNMSSALAETPTVKEAAADLSVGYLVIARGGAGRNTPRYEALSMLDTGAGGADGGRSSSMAPAAVVSNAAVPQDRFHSDSD